MVKYVSTALKFIIIAIIYIIIFRIIRLMYIDLKRKGQIKEDMDLALEVLDAPDNINISRGSVYPIRDSITIGRKDDNSIVIEDVYVSNYHAKILLEDDIYIKDLDSTNGTYVNGKRIVRLTKISEGDLIEIGRVTFKVI
ncbi:FHA domain-containing protein [Caloramator sp. mosi_1]|uniref:FHA domain-containing protein n=1 Tax=Caloramator sp. mosi_1 TaxID=3023090 RepID=UPI0023623EF0|nr:FHA domain-containing protein [Caloramator sp. mosi_1]WDC83754.1 FHA domain-containing protein [Caloramator sp. mosi_1]